MRVLSIGNFTTGWDGSICDEEHIAKALEEMGHEVVRLQRETARQTDVENADLILVAQWDGYDETLLMDYKDIFKCPLVYWAFDYQADGQEWHQRLIEQSDLYLSKRIADSKYPNWQWLSQDFAPSFLDRYGVSHGIPSEIANVPKDIDVLFTGSYLPWATERNETLAAVNDEFNLVIHSVNQWPDNFKDVRPPIMDEGLPELYARAKVILSIDHTLEAGYWSDRNAQIMACEGFVLTRYVPLMETVFRDKVEYFYSIADCLRKIRHLLGYEMERKARGSLGYRYAQENLMVKNRVQNLLTIVDNHLAENTAVDNSWMQFGLE